MTIKMGATKDGKITAAKAWLAYQAGAFPGSPIGPGCMCVFAPYDIENAEVEGYDVVVNRPKVAAYRAPGAPISEFASEGVVDEIAKKLGIDPAEFRLMNAAKEGTRALYGPKFGPVGLHRDPGGRAQQRALQQRRSAPTRVAASPPASGSTSAASPAPPSTSTRTARRP